MNVLNQSMLRTALALGTPRGCHNYYLHKSWKGVFIQFPGLQNGIVVTPTATIPVESLPSGYKKFLIHHYISSTPDENN